MRQFAELHDIELTVIDNDTRLPSFKDALRWNEVLLRFKTLRGRPSPFPSPVGERGPTPGAMPPFSLSRRGEGQGEGYPTSPAIRSTLC